MPLFRWRVLRSKESMSAQEEVSPIVVERCSDASCDLMQRETGRNSSLYIDRPARHSKQGQLPSSSARSSLRRSPRRERRFVGRRWHRTEPCQVDGSMQDKAQSSRVHFCVFISNEQYGLDILDKPPTRQAFLHENLMYVQMASFSGDNIQRTYR